MWIELFIANTVIGVLLLEWAWMKTKPLRNRNPEYEKQFPAFSRHDKWSKGFHYFGAPFLIFKGILGCITLLIICYSAVLINIG